MRSNRRRNWFLKRIAVGLAIAAFAAPVAQAKVDEGTSSGQQVVNAADYGMPRAMPSDYAANRIDRISLRVASSGAMQQPAGSTSTAITQTDGAAASGSSVSGISHATSRCVR